jgi:hypothetical protein
MVGFCWNSMAKILLWIFAIVLFLESNSIYAQSNRRLSVVDESNFPVAGVQVTVVPQGYVSYTNNQGVAYIQVHSESRSIWLEKAKYEPVFLPLSSVDTFSIQVRLLRKELMLDTFQVTGRKPEDKTFLNGVELKPKDIKNIPSPFGDFNSVLGTLGSVVMPSEFSGQYAVRGGNFDENLIYVNGIETYRPFLARTSQQDGLSFVNPDMVESATFSAGGWEARYGDKLSSVLSVKYREPKKFKANATASLLHASAHAESATRDKTLRISAGLRYKSAAYLIRTLPVKGNYRPRFVDFQLLVQWQPLRKSAGSSLKSDKLKVILFSNAASNYFLVAPQKQTSSFGTLGEAFKLEVDFKGQEIMQYNTVQNSLLVMQKKGALRLEYLLSQIRSKEIETFDVLSRYSLCQVQTNQNASDFNECLLQTGAGQSFRHARNELRLDVLQATHRGSIEMTEQSKLLWGITTGVETFVDDFSEYNFEDSASYLFNLESRQANSVFSVWRHQAYSQLEMKKDSVRKLVAGIRMHWWAQTKQVLVSPRISFEWKRDPLSKKLYRISTGLYQQAPFFRELRRPDGTLNKHAKAQSSAHLVTALEISFDSWGREFKFTSEAYGKYLWNVIPYDMDNLRLRYSAENTAEAYVYGADFRVSGEFVKGDESWFSLGILRTRENVQGDSLSWIRRPTDQLITAGVFFQDHLPNNPSLKVFINLVYGSGLPFGPYGYPNLRQSFRGAPYRRVDIGFSKLVTFTDKEINSKSVLDKLWVRVEVLNLLQSINTFSYTWIRDYNSDIYAIPNSLSSRFINIKLVAEL